MPEVPRSLRRMRSRLLATACAAALFAITGCVGASSCVGPAFKTFSSVKTGGAASPEVAASRYAATMRSPKAPTDGWVNEGGPRDGEAFVVNGDWRFRTVRLTDRTWAVESGERCDQE